MVLALYLASTSPAYVVLVDLILCKYFTMQVPPSLVLPLSHSQTLSLSLTHTHTHTHIHTYTHTHVRTYTHTHTHSLSLSMREQWWVSLQDSCQVRNGTPALRSVLIIRPGPDFIGNEFHFKKN